jgi:hypothetical protein
MDSYLIDTLNVDLFTFSKPKKYKDTDLMISKIKNDSKDVLLQFPKMKVVTVDEKSISLEFTNETGYNKKMFNGLSNIDQTVITHITQHSQDWFGKEIPEQFIAQMYNKFIKSPRSSEHNCTVNLVISKNSEIMDKRNEPTSVSQGNTFECIGQMKYLIFSKDSCYITWEVCTAKCTQKITRVPKFGFIDDPLDVSEEFDSDPEPELITFF